MNKLYACLNSYFEQDDVQNIAIRVGNREKVLCDIYRYKNNPIDSLTLFDMASVTKIIATTTLALLAIDNKLFNTDDLVSKFFNVPENKKRMSIKNLLTHTMGIGYKYLYNENVNYDNIQDYVLNIPSDFEIGTEVSYSCPGYILLGKILEKVFEDRLDRLFDKCVAKPLCMKNTSFLPEKSNKFVNSNLALTDAGVVNDNNCRFLGGIAGNAGLFSNMDDICKYVGMLLNYGSPIISRETFNMSIENYTSELKESRGLGFLYVDEKYKQTGKLFSEGSIGHCGHTGQSVFVDLKSGLYVIILSDATVSTIKKYSGERYDIVTKMREDIHNAICNDLNSIL